MDYSKFRFSATVDWIALEICTLKSHPAWRVQRASSGALSYVTGLDPVTGQDIEITGQQGKSTPTTRFSIRVQNPERFSSVMAILNAIADRDALAEVLVRSMEISFDAFRQSGTTDDELAEMVAHMLHEIARPQNTNAVPRFYTRRGTPELRYGRKSLTAGIQQGSTAMYGNADDNFIVRGYLKNYDTVCSDNGKNKRITLPNRLEHRARIEVRLQGQSEVVP